MTETTVTSLQAWICPDHGIVDADYVKRTQDDDYCLHGHDSPQQVSMIEVVPAAELTEARAAHAKITVERDRWKNQFTSARVELAEVKAAQAPEQGDITAEAAANLVREARNAQHEAENEAKAWKETALKARDRGDSLEARLNELDSAPPVDTDITTDAAAGLVREARAAQAGAERDRDAWKAKSNEWLDRAGVLRIEADELRNRLALQDSDITTEAAARLVQEARTARDDAEQDRDRWQAKAKEWRDRSLEVQGQLDNELARPQPENDITTEAAANLVAEARSAQALVEKERDELKGQVDAWRDRYAKAMREIDVKPPPVDTDITTEAAANLVAEARSAQEAAERERDDLQIERDQWKRRYGEARSEAPRLRVPADDSSVKVEATTNLLNEARASLAVAERERDEAKLQAERWRQHYGEARAETTRAERRLTRDDSAELQVKREQLAEIDAIARDARNFLAVADVPKTQDDERRSILRRLRSAVS